MPFIKEELLHHIWQYRLFSQRELRTVDGEVVEILKPGTHNSNAGPDFQNARVRLAGTEWVGNVEIHIRSSDWLRHSHQHDASYSNIILHVVFEDDLKEPLGKFPTLELRDLVSDQVLRRYESLSRPSEELPCANQLMEVPELNRTAWFESLLIARLQRKSEWTSRLVEGKNGDLEQAFTAVVFRAFGMKVNAEPFEQLAKRISWKVLSKHQDNLFQLEALLFGAAGLLSDAKDEYQNGLKKEFDFLSRKYSIEPLNASVWKFLRLRPANFATIRLAQLAALFYATGAFFKWFSNQDEIGLDKLMVEPSVYWKTHYNFGVESKPKLKRIGKTMARNIIINAVAPFLFVSAHREGKPAFQEKALALLEQLDAESNVKVNAFSKHGLEVRNAAMSQALIELKSNYCDHNKCLNCSIGANILRRGS